MECREIEITYKRAKANSQLKQIRSSETVYELCHEFIPDGLMNLREMFFVAYLNRAGKVLGVQKVSEGGTAGTTVDVKLIMATALKCLASTMVLIHNHPSGTLMPSIADDNLTKKILDAAKLFDIKVADHVIVTDSGYYSYCDKGRMYANQRQ